jgi:chromosome partitioning protein
VLIIYSKRWYWQNHQLRCHGAFIKYKVLVIDFDSQGNAREFLTRKHIYEFTGHTILEVCKQKDAAPYIQKITDNLHLIPAEDILSTFSRWLYTEHKGDST